MSENWQLGKREVCTSWPPDEAAYPALAFLYQELDKKGLIAVHGSPMAETVEEFLLRLAHAYLLTNKEKKAMG